MGCGETGTRLSACGDDVGKLVKINVELPYIEASKCGSWGYAPVYRNYVTSPDLAKSVGRNSTRNLLMDLVHSGVRVRPLYGDATVANVVIVLISCETTVKKEER